MLDLEERFPRLKRGEAPILAVEPHARRAVERDLSSRLQADGPALSRTGRHFVSAVGGLRDQNQHRRDRRSRRAAAEPPPAPARALSPVVDIRVIGRFPEGHRGQQRLQGQVGLFDLVIERRMDRVLGQPLRERFPCRIVTVAKADVPFDGACARAALCLRCHDDLSRS